jgi:hypothetical protein
MIKMNEIMKAIISHTNSKLGPKGLNTKTLFLLERSQEGTSIWPKSIGINSET